MVRRKLFYSIIFLAIALGLVFFSRSAPVSFLRSSVVAIFRPVFQVSRVLGRAVGLSAGQPGADELSRLQKENQRLREIEQEYRMLLEKNASLQKIIGLKEKQRVPLQGARVLVHGNEFGKEFLMIDSRRNVGVDEGATKKIRPGNLVIDANGAFLGVVRETGEQFAKVSVASNPGETFEVAAAPLNVKALAKGIGNRTFSIELIPDETPVRSGDFVLMPGRLGDTNVRVGEITRATSNGAGAFQSVWATLIARPETLDEVFVILE